MNLITTLCLILTTGFLAWETDRLKPRPYPIGTTGDTLMVRINGYEFCPKNCDVNHFHMGHFNNYDCEEEVCSHLTINNE